MNFEGQSNRSSSVLPLENLALSYETQTASYGLNLAETTSNEITQFDPISSSNLELEPIYENDTSSLVFIDSGVEDIQTLTDNISGAAEVVVLDSDRDELLQISEHLSNYQDIDAVHIVSHGESGELSIL